MNRSVEIVGDVALFGMGPPGLIVVGLFVISLLLSTLSATVLFLNIVYTRKPVLDSIAVLGVNLFMIIPNVLLIRYVLRTRSI